MTPRSVLIIENKVDSQTAVANVLLRNGYTVERAGDLRDASKRLRLRNFDAVLLHVRAPEAHNALQELGALHPEVLPRLLIVTNQLSSADAGDQRVYAFVRKPFDAAQLLEAISGCVDQRRDGASPLLFGFKP